MGASAITGFTPFVGFTGTSEGAAARTENDAQYLMYAAAPEIKFIWVKKNEIVPLKDFPQRTNPICLK